VSKSAGDVQFIDKTAGICLNNIASGATRPFAGCGNLVRRHQGAYSLPRGGGAAAAAFVAREFDFRPAAIIERLNLLQPIYSRTTNYGHFGKPGLPWET